MIMQNGYSYPILGNLVDQIDKVQTLPISEKWFHSRIEEFLKRDCRPVI